MKQDMDQASDIQIYPIGMRYAIDDRAFRYAKAGGTLNSDLGAKNALLQCIAYTDLYASAPAGATQVSIDIAATDGVLSNGVIGVDELAGGYVVFFPGAENSFVRRIVKNTATTVADAAGVMTLTIDKPLPCALTAANGAECIASIYSNVRTDLAVGDSPLYAVVGIPTVPATVGQYLWLQTWGPCWVAAHADVGKLKTDMAAYFVGDGSLGQGEEDTPEAVDTGLVAQYAGFVLASAKDGTQGAPFIFLQLAP